ncbi:hypothetical protein I4U23_011080 [Adineta vaga]|nr:hypothetical protein I4U23_011080 [Adineta vaga]
MNSFRRQVDIAIASDPLKGNLVSKEFAVTGSGRNIAFLVTSVVWYALRVYIEDRDNNHVVQHARTEHLTMEGAREQMEKFKREM